MKLNIKKFMMTEMGGELEETIKAWDQALEERRKALGKTLQEFQFEDLNEYYYSAPVKRMIWQAVQALKEITQIMGHNPKRIFIEMTRTEEEKGEQGRKNSREKRLLKLI